MKHAAFSAVVMAAGLLAAPAYAGPVDNAFALCRVLDSTGMLSEKCSVSGLDAAVDIRVNMVPAEARDLCLKVGNSLGGEFGGRWQMRIYSPYSGEHPIASCPLA